jgi:flagellar protein FlbD
VIHLTRLSGHKLYLNADLICSVEAHPDTVVTLVDGKHYVVTEPTAEVVEAITRYRAGILALADSLAGPLEEAAALEATVSSAPNNLYMLHGERD